MTHLHDLMAQHHVSQYKELIVVTFSKLNIQLKIKYGGIKNNIKLTYG